MEVPSSPKTGGGGAGEGRGLEMELGEPMRQLNTEFPSISLFYELVQSLSLSI